MKYVYIILLCYIYPLSAQTVSFDMGMPDGGSTTGKLLQLMLTLTMIGMAPFVLMTVTSFTRIMVVLSFLRSAIGLQQSPPNMVMVALSLFLTGYIMEPIFQKAYTEGVEPLIAEKISEKEALPIIAKPFKEFMLSNTRPKDLLMFQDIAKAPATENIDNIELKVLVPAFVISELRRAFEIGFLIYIPFLIIDMIVASILMSMGMMMLPPVVISLPFKVIFFVLIDGWNLIAGTLIQSFHP
jgi:flagellar biosynthetic protein FliP